MRFSSRHFVGCHRIARVVILPMLALALQACFGSVAYHPAPRAESIRPAMPPAAALRDMRDCLKNSGVQLGGQCRYRYENIDVTIEKFSFTYSVTCNDGEILVAPQSHAFRFRELPSLSIEHWSGTPKGYNTNTEPNIWWEQGKFEYARRFADAANAIKYYSSGSDVADDEPVFAMFREDAKRWRALPVKPAQPEAVRRSRLMAEDAIKSKSFEEAVEYYEQGLQAAPLWPEGHFNAALLYGELRIFGQAVIHMRRYLELGPDAPDAPAARDQLVIWQGKLPQAPPAAHMTGGGTPSEGKVRKRSK